jgi:hypothetical protein
LKTYDARKITRVPARVRGAIGYFLSFLLLYPREDCNAELVLDIYRLLNAYIHHFISVHTPRDPHFEREVFIFIGRDRAG